MKVERVSLKNFRNVEESSLVADPHLNFLVGKNGQGKTSFLEALGYLATLRSFRGSKTEEVIQWGCPSAEVTCEIASDLGEWRTELRVAFEREGNRSSKMAFINGKAFRSSTQYLSQRFGAVELGFHCVVFNPSDHDLVRGDPAGRRAYLNRILAAEDVDYLRTYQKYQRVLDQRNALLRTVDRPSAQLLAGFTEPLGELGAWIAYRRLAWFQSLAARLNDVVHKIAPNQPELRAIYRSNWFPEIGHLSNLNSSLDSIHFSGQDTLPSLEVLEQAFWRQQSSLEQAELRARSSLVGPHRDDWTFVLGDQVLKGHGSQGEVRSALLAMKLCEIELFRKRTGHRPLLLLDDFSSELDQERRSFLLRFLVETDLQVFVTTTEDSLNVGRRFWVANGKLSEGRNEAQAGL